MSYKAEPKVAILLPVFNGEKFVNQQVETIILQENVSVSIFISLDKSTDNSEQMINDLVQKYSHIYKLNHNFKEPKAGRNIFYLIKEIDFEKFDYIAFADQDDIWFVNKLYESIRKLESSNFSAYSANVFSKGLSSKKKRIVYKHHKQKKWDHLFESAGPGCTYVIKKNIAIQLQNQIKLKWKQIVNINHPDWLIYAFVKSLGENWFIDRVARMIYIQHSNNDMGENRGYSAFIRRLKMLTSKYWFNQSIEIVKCLDIHNNSFCNQYIKLDRKSFLFLARNARDCRRKPLEQLFFFLVCIYLSIFNFGK